MKYIATAVILIALGGCRGRHSRQAVQNEESSTQQTAAPQQMASALKTNDPGTASQLLHGFYGIEGNAWRWTAGKFSIMLRTPLGSAQKGAALTFSFALPEVVLKKTGPVKLTASVDGKELKSESYSKAGGNDFKADIPAAMLTKDSVIIDFAMDKSLPPNPAADNRELGLIAAAAGLESK